AVSIISSINIHFLPSMSPIMFIISDTFAFGLLLSIIAIEFLKGKKGVVGVFCGDAPLIKPETVESLFKTHIENNNSATLLSSIVDDPTGYGRVVRENDEVLKIVEHKDCTEEELKINEMKAAIYCFDIELLLNSLDKLSNNNNKGEFYFTD
ncbi:hypothetical protein GNF72_16920, partial [Clostridium perfringens]|uniref:sugar phosphate nucleotidyltransferase n=1 Tax=Clostridium perfringens TaxID=1502 RepID=UPI002AC6B726